MGVRLADLKTEGEEVALLTPKQQLRDENFLVALRRPFVAAFIAFAIAQITKLFTFWYTENRWDYTRIVGSGGMPSSHTAMVSISQSKADDVATFSVSLSAGKPYLLSAPRHLSAYNALCLSNSIFVCAEHSAMPSGKR